MDEEAWLDSRIEVVDLDGRTTLCSRTLDHVVLPGFVKSGPLATYHEDASGSPTITIWSLELRQ